MEAPGLNPNTTELVKNPNPVLEEWFMISSKAFLDTNRFPTIGKRNKNKTKNKNKKKYKYKKYKYTYKIK